MPSLIEVARSRDYPMFVQKHQRPQDALSAPHFLQAAATSSIRVASKDSHAHRLPARGFETASHHCVAIDLPHNRPHIPEEKMDQFQNLVDGLEASQTKPEAVSALSRFLAATHIEHYAYLGFQHGPKHDEAPVRAGSFPAVWIDEYMGDHLYAVDPVVLSAATSTVPLFWGDELAGARGTAHQPAQELFERARRYGIRSGYTIPIRSSIGQLATLTFVSSKNRAEHERQIGAFQSQLHLGAFYFHNALERISTPARSAFLTARERLCLTLSSQGHSVKEIARILTLNPRTVRFHHDNARAKLGAANLRQALHTATCSGLI